MYIPIVSLNRSQEVTIGGASPDALGRTSQGNQSLFHALHANLGRATTRRDLQRHSAIGSYIEVGNVTSKWSDLIASTNSIVSAGSGLTINTAAFTLSSRLFTDQASLAVAATTNTLAVPALSTNDVIYSVRVKSDGTFVVVPGPASNGSPVYEVDTVAITGTPTGGTFTLSFTYNGYNYTTATIAYNAVASAVASAILAATANGSYLALPASTVTGSGSALPAGPVTLTASGLLEGPITNQSINVSGLTGGTNVAGSFVQTTAGVGAGLLPFGGNSLPVAYVLIPSGATSVSSGNIQNIALTS
jgi:hypothetical protein